MKILLSIEHPAWAHQFRYVIHELESLGHDIKVVAINKDHDLELLDKFKIPYEVISDSSGENTLEKGLIFLKTTLKIFIIARKFHPDLFLGRSSPMMAINSALLRKPHIVFEDSEKSIFSLTLCKLCSSVIITPMCFNLNLGRKHIRIKSFKELFYLHPNYFKPDSGILGVINSTIKQKIILLRLVAWKAHHDIGQSGIIDKLMVIKKLEPFGKIYISSENVPDSELQKYILNSTFEQIHDVLSYSDLFFSDSQTMTTEAAVLGVPAIRCNSFVGTKDMANFIELEKKYGLIYNFSDIGEALEKALEILNKSDIKEEWERKRQNFLKDQIDIVKFMIWFVEDYPNSFSKMKRDPDYQDIFK